MTFPYEGTQAVAGLACDASGAYFRFTNNPNLSGDQTHDGFNGTIGGD